MRRGGGLRGPRGDRTIYESRDQRPISRRAFLARLGAHALTAGALLAGSLFAGMAGYHFLEGLDWREAFLNAAMLLGGMGPVDAPKSHGGQIFAGLYALYAGLVFLVAAAVLLAPVIHRILHRFHWDGPEE